MPRCKHCLHPADLHLDRALVPCGVDGKPPRIDHNGQLQWGAAQQCRCPGYEEEPC